MREEKYCEICEQVIGNSLLGTKAINLKGKFYCETCAKIRIDHNRKEAKKK